MEAKQIAETILIQLGGRRFMVMTGAKDFTFDADGTLRFRIGRNPKGVNRVAITLDPSDTYSIRFERARLNRKALRYDVKVIASHSDIYCDQLREVFESETGLYTSL